jgi:hypothetical protein
MPAVAGAEGSVWSGTPAGTAGAAATGGAGGGVALSGPFSRDASRSSSGRAEAGGAVPKSPVALEDWLAAESFLPGASVSSKGDLGAFIDHHHAVDN